VQHDFLLRSSFQCSFFVSAIGSSAALICFGVFHVSFSYFIAAEPQRGKYGKSFLNGNINGGGRYAIGSELLMDRLNLDSDGIIISDAIISALLKRNK
jgi:hypothetical protein